MHLWLQISPCLSTRQHEDEVGEGDDLRQFTLVSVPRTHIHSCTTSIYGWIHSDHVLGVSFPLSRAQKTRIAIRWYLKHEPKYTQKRPSRRVADEPIRRRTLNQETKAQLQHL